MKNNKEYSDWFDDDFEVTYEEDYRAAGDAYHTSGDTREYKSSGQDTYSSDETVYMDSEKYNRYLAGYDRNDYDDNNDDDLYSDEKRKSCSHDFPSGQFHELSAST